MPKAKIVKGGKEYLINVSLQTLQKMQRSEPRGKAKNILQTAILRKQGKTLEAIAVSMGHPKGTIYGWLSRLESEGLERRYDREIPGRPPRLTRKQMKAIGKDLSKPPRESGFERDRWTSKMVSMRIRDRFDMTYSQKSAHRLIHKLGFSTKTSAHTVQQRHTGGKEHIKKIRQGIAR